jgi:Cu+-exporting ATPase
METVTCQVNGMSCSSCTMTVTGYLEKKGMKEVVVSLATGKVSFMAQPGTDIGELLSGINRLGYQVLGQGSRRSKLKEVLQDTGNRFLFCALFTMLLMADMWLPGNGRSPWLQCLLATPVYLGGLWHFGRSALGAIRQGIANMDLLITTGASAAYFYSLYGVVNHLGPGYLFFDTAAAIITIVLLGNLLEQRSVRQTATALTELAAMQSTRARRMLSSGLSEEVDSLELQSGDEVLVNEGERVPGDGTVVRGTGSINESMITGEPLPVQRETGNPVIAGTLLEEGSIRVRITATGSATVLSGIINLVQQAQQQKTPIQKLADRISAIFVPAVLVIAAGVLVISLAYIHLPFSAALMRAIAVLVIACPCAMGLATPAAVMTGLGRAARNGILIRGADTLERFRHIKTVVFDKTGTLTTGKLIVTGFHSSVYTEDDFTSLVASLEQHSSHPIAKSILEQWKPGEVSATLEVSEIRGSGIRASDGASKQYLLGSFGFTSSYGVPPGHDIYLVADQKPAGWLDLGDGMRPETPGVVSYLTGKGIRSVLLSGDRKEKCLDLARQAGIGEVYFEQSPGQKMALLQSLMKSGGVAMVGDGINDAPALAAATVGITLSEASEVARQTASVVLMNNQLGKLPLALELGKHTVTTIRENLFWAFFYNIIAIPLAAAGLLHPMIAAASMGLSDIFLVANSIRLRYKKLL